MTYPILPYVREPFSSMEVPPLPQTKARRSEHQAVGQVRYQEKVWYGFFKRRIKLTIGFSDETRENFRNLRLMEELDIYCRPVSLPLYVHMFVSLDKGEEYRSDTDIGIMFGYADIDECHHTGEEPLVPLEGVKMGGSW